MSKTENFDIAFYEPAQVMVYFDGKNFFSLNGLALQDPNEYPFEDGFMKLEPNEYVN